MLVLSRRLRQTIIISHPAAPGEAIEVTVIGVGDDEVRLGVRAPSAVAIRRRETPGDGHAPGRQPRRGAQTSP